MSYFPLGMHMSWGLGLVLAALVLGNKATDPLPWAMAVLGGVVFFGALISHLADESIRNADAAAHEAVDY